MIKNPKEGSESGEGSTAAVNYTSFQADLYLEAFGFNWLTKQFTAQLHILMAFFTLYFTKCSGGTFNQILCLVKAPLCCWCLIYIVISNKHLHRDIWQSLFFPECGCERKELRSIILNACCSI